MIAFWLNALAVCAFDPQASEYKVLFTGLEYEFTEALFNDFFTSVTAGLDFTYAPVYNYDYLWSNVTLWQNVIKMSPEFDFILHGDGSEQQVYGSVFASQIQAPMIGYEPLASSALLPPHRDLAPNFIHMNAEMDNGYIDTNRFVISKGLRRYWLIVDIGQGTGFTTELMCGVYPISCQMLDYNFEWQMTVADDLALNDYELLKNNASQWDVLSCVQCQAANNITRKIEEFNIDFKFVLWIQKYPDISPASAFHVVTVLYTRAGLHGNEYDDSTNRVNFFPRDGERSSMQVALDYFTDAKIAAGLGDTAGIEANLANRFSALYYIHHATLEAREKNSSNITHVMRNLRYFTSAFGTLGNALHGSNNGQQKWITSQYMPVEWGDMTNLRENVWVPQSMSTTPELYLIPPWDDRFCFPDCHSCKSPDYCEFLHSMSTWALALFPVAIIVIIVFMYFSLGLDFQDCLFYAVLTSFNCMSMLTSSASVLTIVDIKPERSEFSDFLKYTMIVLAAIDAFGNASSLFITLGSFMGLITMESFEDAHMLFYINPGMFFVDAGMMVAAIHMLYSSDDMYVPESLPIVFDAMINSVECFYFMSELAFPRFQEAVISRRMTTEAGASYISDSFRENKQ